MPAFADFRFDPFSNTYQLAQKTNEIYLIPSSSPFTIRLYEVPFKESPSSLTMRVVDYITAAITTAGQTSISVDHGSWFAIDDVITIDSERMLVTNVSGNTLTVTRGYQSTTATTHTASTKVYIEASMTEVAATPVAKQFWADYNTGANNDPNWNTGTIMFNSADGGKTVAVTYKGMGTLMDQRVVPSGLIAKWKGTVATIPYGWALCDGNNGTPDLRDKFVVGAGSGYSPGNTGGANYVTLVESTSPYHTHTIPYTSAGSTNPGDLVTSDGGSYGTKTTSAFGGGGSHENRPPYYALAYIMKL